MTNLELHTRKAHRLVEHMESVLQSPLNELSKDELGGFILTYQATLKLLLQEMDGDSPD